MNGIRIWMFGATALAVLGGPATAGPPAPSGKELFERHCSTCHGGAAPADSPIAPNLAGIVGARAGTQASGTHSRAVSESGVVWDRDSLRRFLSEPWRAVPGTLMPVRVDDPRELESLLDYLESLR
jgi:cytochrome c